MIKNATILVIDDEPNSLMLTNVYLSHVCKHLLLQTEVEAAIDEARIKQPDVILLDVILKGGDGYDICRRLKADKDTQHIPVIFLTSLMRADDKVKGFDAGCVDFITKPFNVNEMIARINSCLKIHQRIRKTELALEKESGDETKVHTLTERELKTLSLYASGYKRSEISKELFVSENTVKWYIKNIFEKLKIKNRSQAIEKAREMSLLDS